MTLRFAKVIAIFGLTFLIIACNSKHLAPVVNAWQTNNGKASGYRVKRGDTLYSVAWAFGKDYREIARINRLKSPYRIEPGEILKMNAKETAVAATALRPPQVTMPKRPSKKYLLTLVRKARPPEKWSWPARGRVIEGFSGRLAGNKGINIAGSYGEPVRAAATGVVVYSGDGVRGYGNLVIVKHNDDYLSAYAYNQKRLVKTGDRVKAGQVIARMGRNNAGKPMLHFEIRRNGKPVDPLQFLT